MPLNGFSINTSGSPRRLATRDTEAYWRRLIAAGGPDLNSTGRLSNLATFLAAFYAEVGWSSSNLIWFLGDNIGSGSKALAFSGPDLTLVNGPGWVSNSGVSFDGVDDRLDATIADSRYGTWISLIYQPAYVSGFSTHWIAYNNAGRGSGCVRQVDNGNSTTFAASTIPASSTITTGSMSGTVGGWGAGFIVRQSASFNACFNAGALTAGTTPSAISNPVDRLRIGNRDDGTAPAFSGTIARFLAYTPTAISASQKSTLYAALKFTIGSDLSLP